MQSVYENMQEGSDSYFTPHCPVLAGLLFFRFFLPRINRRKREKMYFLPFPSSFRY